MSSGLLFFLIWIPLSIVSAFLEYLCDVLNGKVLVWTVVCCWLFALFVVLFLYFKEAFKTKDEERRKDQRNEGS